MSELTTEHRGYKIRYSENESVWRCWDLDLEHATLTGLKNAINRAIQKAARAQIKAPAWYVSDHSAPEPVVITAYAGVAYADGDKSADHVWVVVDERGVKKRQKRPASKIIMDTPENRMWLDELNRLIVAERAASAATRGWRKTAPSTTVAALKEAGVIAGVEGKDGEEANEAA